MLEFLNLHYLFLILPIFIFIVLLYKKGSKTISFGDAKNLKNIFSKNTINYKIYYFLVFLIFIFYVLIFSNLVEKNSFTEKTYNGIDIVITIDVSSSMLAEDIKPNRLEATKKIINKFLNKSDGNRIGVVTFAAKPFTSLPLNTDKIISQKIVNKIDTEIIDNRLQGTSIGDALVLSAELFEKNNSREKIIVLITDGDSNRDLIKPIPATKLILKENKNLKIYSIGIGGKNKAFITYKDVFGNNRNYEVAPLNENLLKEISSISSGEYFRATDNNVLNNIFNKLSEITKSEIKEKKNIVYNEKNIYLVYFLLILFFILFTLMLRKKI